MYVISTIIAYPWSRVNGKVHLCEVFSRRQVLAGSYMDVRKSPVCRETTHKLYEIRRQPIENSDYLVLKCDSNAVSKASITGRQGLTINGSSEFYAAVSLSQIPPSFPQKTDLRNLHITVLG